MAFFSDAPVTVLPLKKYDVFISFRGDDTRVGFTGHLHSALCRSYVETYIDYRIEKGKQVWGELEIAIEDSSVFVVVFSENYASSTWCLDELVQIMECHKNGQAHVIPVFYNIDPSHVRKQTGSYGTGLAEHHKKHDGKEKMQKWKEALSEAANLSGFHSTKYGTEIDLIEGVVKEVLGKLNHEHANKLGGHFIPNENYWRVESLIISDSRKAQIIGLWGMRGIGKTTLASAIFHKVSSQYDGNCFLENVTKESKMHGINYICNRLLSKLLREDNIGIETPKVIPFMVMRRLKRMKVFIVLDGVRTSELLQNLIGAGWRGWLGAGSIVIVTTRNKNVLESGGVDEIYQIKGMNSQNSLQLFSLNAFNRVLPKDGYVELSERAIDYAKGNPLALKVLGSSLHSKSEIEWHSALAKLKEIPNSEVHKVLRWSFKELDDMEKNILLDIACFFRGHKRDTVTKILNDCGFFADIGMRNLLDKALIKIYFENFENYIEMHDLIHEMGKKIVREESPKNPEQRSRLWDHKEVCDVLKNNRGTKRIEAIFLDMTQITHINLSSKAFENMPNLRLLAFRDHKGTKSISLPSGLDLLPENLRYFQWDGYPLKTLPLTFRAEMVVELSLPNTKLEKLWNGVQNLPNLEILDLKGSKQLIECPNVSGCPNLKRVELNYCTSLPDVDSTIFSLQKLEVLKLYGCKSLKRLSGNTCPPSLQVLNAMGCNNLQEFSVPLMTNIASIDRLILSLGEFGLNKFPTSLLHTKNMHAICFPISDNFVDLPENFARTICLFKPVEREHDASITLHKLFPSPGFRSVRLLVIDNCDSLSEIPDNISLLLALESLTLFKVGISSLPETIKYLPRLKRLAVGKSKMLRSVPALPQSIEFLHVWNCESLQIVSGFTGEPSQKFICIILLINCIKLDPHSYDTIFKDAIVETELKARLHLDEDRGGLICLLPATSSIVQDWFHYHSTQAFGSVELPPNLLGFVFYLVLSQGRMGLDVGFGCECYLETSSNERIIITSIVNNALFMSLRHDEVTSVDMVSDHLLLWYDPRRCKNMLEAVEERKAVNDVSRRYNPKLTFRFFIDETDLYDEVEIKECGFRWIYPSEDQIVVEEEEGKSKSKCLEIHELEANAVQNREYKSDEQEQRKDARSLLEELLHIGFVGDLVNEEMEIATDEAYIWYDSIIYQALSPIYCP